MNTPAVREVLGDLVTFLNDTIATHSVATMGLNQLVRFLETLPVAPENPDPEFFIGIGDPNTEAARQYASWPLSRLKSEIVQYGPIEARLSQQWVVYAYTGWEHEYRPRLATAHGCAEGDLRYPVLGDLRRLRHDVVHHHGVASAQNAGSCEQLHWFEEGDIILVRGEHFVEFLNRFPIAEMEAGPEGAGSVAR